MKKRLLCAVFAASVLITGLAGCSGSSSTANSITGSESAASQADGNSKAKASDSAQSGNSGSSDFGTFTAQKTGSVNFNAKSTNITSSGVIYQDENGKYGIVSLDGKSDSGAKYKVVKEETAENNQKGFFIVADVSDNLNSCGLADENGVEIVPCKYASVSLLNDKYAKAVTADKITNDKDSALVYSTDKMFSLSPSEGDTMYTGKWEIYDLEKKAALSGVSGTKPYRISAKGDFITFTDDSGKEHTKDGSGNEITDGRKLFSDGSYVLEINGNSAVFSNDGERLFNFDSKDYSINSFDGYYYEARTSGGKYKLISKDGEFISPDFNSSLSYVTNDFVLCDNYIYKTDGTKAFQESFTSLKYDKTFKDAYCAYNSEKEIVFDKQGNILLQFKKDEDGYGDDNFYRYKKTDDGHLYYNYKDKSYSLDGYIDNNWFVKKNVGNVYDMYETRTGSKLIDSYGSFDAVIGRDNTQYIFAYNSINGSTEKGNYDIFVVTAK